MGYYNKSRVLSKQFCAKVTRMQNPGIDMNIAKTISPATECRVSCSPIICDVNAELIAVTPLSPTLHPLTNTFHNMVTAVIAVLYASRPRALRLARSVSSRAFFLVVSGFYPMFVIPANTAVDEDIEKSIHLTCKRRVLRELNIVQTLV